jgi:ureidoacrylate peracid hydrolase
MPIKGVKPGEIRQHPFEETIIWEIVPGKTATIIIDMQNAFVDEKGLSYCAGTKDVLPRINRIAGVSRDHGIPVVWVRHSYRPDALDGGFQRDFFPRMINNPTGYMEGAWGAEFYPDLDIREEDTIVTKKRFNAFVPGASNLDRVLRYMGIDTVIIIGVATNVCCGTTAMDAMMLDYKVIFVSDANAGFGPEILHEAQILNMRAMFAMVCTTDELIEEIGGVKKD